MPVVEETMIKCETEKEKEEEEEEEECHEPVAYHSEGMIENVNARLRGKVWLV